MKVRDRFDKNRIGDLVCDGAYKYVQNFAVEIDGERVAEYDSLDGVVEEWEDYEEPKAYWYINSCGVVEVRLEEEQPAVTDMHKQSGNYFETKEEAEKAVEKLKAWKRLKDKGFKFEGIKEDFTRILQQNPFRTGKRYLQFNKSEDEDWMKENWNDLDLLFGEEEE